MSDHDIVQPAPPSKLQSHPAFKLGLAVAAGLVVGVLIGAIAQPPTPAAPVACAAP
jgi:hypothetical protein